MKNPNQHKEVEVVEYSNSRDGIYNVASYDAIRYQGPANAYRQRIMENAYSRLVGSLEGKRILDVGRGTGRGLLRFARQAKSAVGCDASRDMLNFAAGKIADRTNCTFVAAYAQQLPFEDDEFDVVISLDFLHLFTLATQREMITEMKRVTKPGGTIVLEFDNALHGLVVGLYKRWFGYERGSLPWEIRHVLWNNCKVVRVYGAVFPVIWRFLRRFPEPSVALEKIAYTPPFNRLSHRIYYKLVKEGK
jgi:ubiquinone/menaquinone biosynthesis C-methylase UbiE